MRGWFTHRGEQAPPEIPAGLAITFSVTENACCCPARPVVRVVMPATATRPHPVELLLCNHHYRVSRAALRAVGATAYDPDGVVLMSGIADAGIEVPEAGAEPSRLTADTASGNSRPPHG
jgi:hypothetical protein